MKGKFLGFTIEYENKEEFRVISHEIVKERSYDLPVEDADLIVDIGAHIGLSIIYFHTRYPNSRIIGFEPNPKLFTILSSNIRNAELPNVDLYQVAVGTENARAQLFIDHTKNNWQSNGSLLSGGWNGTLMGGSIDVETVRLEDRFGDEIIDILKLDAEGYEWQIIRSLGSRIGKVRSIVMEFHGQGKNRLKKIVNYLSDHYRTVVIEQNASISSISTVDPTKLLMIKGFDLKKPQ